MKTVFTLLISFVSFTTAAQVPEPGMVWLKGIGGNGGDQINSNVTKTHDGGFVLSLSSNSSFGSGNIDSLCVLAGGDQVIFMKYNADASILEWSKCYHWTGDTELSYLFPTDDGGQVLGGRYNAASAWGFYICKQDALGNIVWSHGYSKGNNLRISCMMATDDGGYIMGGSSSYADTNVYVHYGSFMDNDIFLIKVDSLGNKVWTKVVGGTDNDVLYSLQSAPNGGCYVAGYTRSGDIDCIGNHGAGDVYLAMLDKNGNILWHKDLGGTGYDYATSAVADNAGGIVIAGVSHSTDGDVTHQADPTEYIWAVGVDSSGHVAWNNSYGGGAENCYPNAICKATDGSIWIAGVNSLKYGEVDTVYGRDDAWFVHTDSVGNFLSAKVLGSHLWDRATMIYPLSNGNVIAGGFYDTAGGSFAPVLTYSSYPNSDAFLTVFTSLPTAIKPIQETGANIKIYPNPVREYFTIETDEKENCVLAIADMFGRTIYSKELRNKIVVETTGWPRGIYLVTMIVETGYKNVQKLIVQ
jgi:hypothetical protein